MRPLQADRTPLQAAGPDGVVEAAGLPGRDPQHYLRSGLLQLHSLPPLTLYLHLPWCLKKCPYCDFNSHQLPTQGAPEDRYVDAVLTDLEAALPLVWGRTVHSVFLGGGTPSLLQPQTIDRLLSAVRARLRLEADCEITLEANPGTFERDRFRAFRRAGVSRLSIGVQSFDDRMLAALGRVHDGAQARAAVEEAARSFDTFNIDLMYALPGQTLDDLDRDLATALSLRPPHLSVYHLTLEPNTRFAVEPPPGLPDEDLASEMLDRITTRCAGAGLSRYEVSAYGRAGHRCRHNLNYWGFGDYLGLGAGAHSKLSFPHRVVRQVRLRDPARYMAQALRGSAVAQEHEVARQDLPFEFMLNALRLIEGVPQAWFTERTGLPLSAVQAAMQEAQRRGLLEPDPARIAPSARGFDFLNDLQALFLPPGTR